MTSHTHINDSFCYHVQLETLAVVMVLICRQHRRHRSLAVDPSLRFLCCSSTASHKSLLGSKLFTLSIV